MSAKKESPVVLCIEDEAKIADVIRESLCFGGFTVLIASNAAEGLELAYSRAPDLILLDLILPDINGYSFFDLLRDGDLSSIPVIIVSGCTSGEAQSLGLRLGAYDYITKPFVVADLIERVRRGVIAGQGNKKSIASRSSARGK